MDLLSRLLWRPGSAVNLAVLRITLCVAMFGGPAYAAWNGRESVEDLPTRAPTIFGFLLVDLPRDPLTLRLVAAGLAVSCFAGALGLRTRWAMWGVLVLGAYHFGVPQIFGKVDHNHHLLWFALIVALSPCGDALSLDSRGTRPAPSVRYGFPLRSAWLALGLAYFFAGFWKIGLIGLDWVTAENLRGIMWDERVARGPDFEPIIDIASNDLLLTIGAVFTVTFELGFVFLIFFRRTRLVAVLAGIGFHLSTGLTMDIWFTGLTVFYVMLVDWDPILERLSSRDCRWSTEEATRTRSSSIALTSVLLFGIVVAGLGRQIDGWPVASYPDFGYRSPETKVTAVVRVDGVDARDQALASLSTLQQHRLLLRAAASADGKSELIDVIEMSDLCAGVTNEFTLATIRWKADRDGLRLIEETSQPLEVNCD